MCFCDKKENPEVLYTIHVIPNADILRLHAESNAYIVSVQLGYLIIEFSMMKSKIIFKGFYRIYISLTTNLNCY